MRIPRPELIEEELDYHRNQVEVLTSLLAISKQHHADRRAAKRVRWRQKKQKSRDQAGCGCGREQPKEKPCGKRSTGSSR